MQFKQSKFLPFSRPSINEDDITAVSNVLRSGWVTTGPKTAEFEKVFCDYTGCAGAVAVSSATGGMHVALKALDIGPGDEVITPSMTWVSTVNLIVLAGAKPVFVDVQRDTLIASPEAIKAAINDKTRLIIPVHFAGASADIGPLRKLAADKNILLVEDAAHALGTEYKGERIGRRGTTIFSFHPIKNITTGEGGMVCSDDKKFLERVRSLKFHGLGVDAYDRQTLGRSPQADIVLDDPYASEFHLRLIRRPEGIVVHDLESTNGTYVNGRRVSTPLTLTRGDAIQIGNTVLEVR